MLLNPSVQNAPPTHWTDYIPGIDTLSCIGECIERNDPLNNFGKFVGVLAGQAFPKSWLVAFIKSLMSRGYLTSMNRGISEGARMIKWIEASARAGSRLTTLPSSLKFFLQKSGPKFLRSIGRIASPIWTAYGLLLAEIEAECAIACCQDDMAGKNYDALIYQAKDKIKQAIQ